TAHMGGVCTLINTSCCTYVDESSRIEVEIQKIWDHAKVLHQVSLDDTSFGFSNLWEKLTSWLPNLTWLKQLFIVVIMITVLGLLVCCMLQCFMWMCKQTASTYEEWKKHKLRQNTESGKYFAKT
ncbi:ERVV2 protein, partial [Himantopus himantopus]|nr:ERVV2 protein [Himantopus himantopus]